jgi:hypothetical protein
MDKDSSIPTPTANGSDGVADTSQHKDNFDASEKHSRSSIQAMPHHLPPSSTPSSNYNNMASEVESLDNYLSDNESKNDFHFHDPALRYRYRLLSLRKPSKILTYTHETVKAQDGTGPNAALDESSPKRPPMRRSLSLHTRLPSSFNNSEVQNLQLEGPQKKLSTENRKVLTIPNTNGPVGTSLTSNRILSRETKERTQRTHQRSASTPYPIVTKLSHVDDTLSSSNSHKSPLKPVKNKKPQRLSAQFKQGFHHLFFANFLTSPGSSSAASSDVDSEEEEMNTAITPSPVPSPAKALFENQSISEFELEPTTVKAVLGMEANESYMAYSQKMLDELQIAKKVMDDSVKRLLRQWRQLPEYLECVSLAWIRGQRLDKKKIFQQLKQKQVVLPDKWSTAKTQQKRPLFVRSRSWPPSMNGI